MTEAFEGHGGDFVAEAMRDAGIDRVFTLSGGHIFPIYDGMHTRGMSIVDVRHEQTAGFAAEGHAKLARVPGVAALTAGPGVTNGVSPIASAHFNGSPLVVLGGRAPQLRWGQGSLQEMDHVPIVASITKHAETVFDPAAIGTAAARAFAVAAQPHRGPVFVDVPLEVFFTRVTAAVEAVAPVVPAIDGDVEAAVRALSEAERPVLLIGSDVWADGAEKAARDLVERLRIPAFMNGMGRGVLPADHELVFSQARGHAFKRADLVVVAGAPLDFRLGFGKFGDAKVIHLTDHPALIAKHVELVAGIGGSLSAIFDALATATERDLTDWIGELRATEAEKRAGFDAELRSSAAPIHPARVYGDLVPKLQRDAIVICDGGDFVSYAGKFVDVYEPGGWLDPGPYGCLGTGPGYALAAGLLYPERQIVIMMGDGAAGFGMGDWDTLIRFGINVTVVVGNNGIWGLEKHPMKFVYGYDVAADLRPETRYDEVMRSLGGHGEMVSDPAELSAALDRALAAEGPSLLNVVTDPAVAYPRSSNLA